MTYLLKIKLPDEAAWTAMYREHFAVERDGEWRPRPGVSNIVHLGVFKHRTGNMVEVDGPGGSKMQAPEMVDAPNPGYHVDMISTFVPTEVHTFLQNPAEPRHVYAGNHVLAMPETLPEADEVLMVTRGIGASVPDEQLARIELQLLRGRITPEMAEDRRAWVEAGVAITKARIAIGEKQQEREQAVAEAQKAAAERAEILARRDAEVARRDAEEAKRIAAVAAAQAATGKARTDALAARDAAIAARAAATAEATKLDADAAAKAAEQAAAMKARDDAAAVLTAEAAKIAAARAARAEAKAAIVDEKVDAKAPLVDDMAEAIAPLRT